jgi:hypothetical protein
MKIKVIAFSIFFLSLSEITFAAGKKNLLIVDFQNISAYGSYAFLKDYMLKIYNDALKAKYKVVPKESYSSVLKELSDISENYLFDRRRGEELGRVLSADYVVMGRYTYADDQNLSVEIILINVKKSIKTTFKQSKLTPKADLLKTATDISIKLCSYILAAAK